MVITNKKIYINEIMMFVNGLSRMYMSGEIAVPQFDGSKKWTYLAYLTESDFDKIENYFLNLIYKSKTNMKNPKVIETVIEGATFKVPTFKVTNEGIEDGSGCEIVFCKGNKEDETVLRQEGVFSETLIQTAKEYLESVNKGALSSRETSTAITKLDEALMWLNKRAEDRKLRGVQSTYQK